MAPVRVDVEKKLLGIIPVKQNVLTVGDNQIVTTEIEICTPRSFVRINGPKVTVLNFPLGDGISTKEITLTPDSPEFRASIFPPPGRLDTPPAIELSFTLIPKNAKTPKPSSHETAVLVRNMFGRPRKKSPLHQ